MNKQEAIDRVMQSNDFLKTNLEWNNCLEVVEAAIRLNPMAIRYASVRFQDDKRLALMAVSGRASAVQYISSSLQDDDEVARIVVNKNKDYAKYLSKRIQDALWVFNDQYPVEENKWLDREWVKQEVARHGVKIKLAGKFKEDKEIAKLAVKNNGLAYLHVSNKLKMDKEIVLLSLTTNKNIYKFLNKALKCDKEITAAYHKLQKKEIQVCLY